MISFRTAYLKAMHPTEFMAAVMSLDIANVEKLAQFFQEAKRMGVKIAPPCVNRSFADFEVKAGQVLYALGALKNVGVEAMRHLVDVREEGGPFRDLFDFARRVDMRIVNKRAIENLARGGAFDAIEPNRALILASAGILQSIGQRASEERNSAQVSLFGDAPEAMAEPELASAAPWSNIEQLDHELGAIGFYFGGHPLETYAKLLERKKVVYSADIEDKYKSGSRAMRLAGVVRKRQERMSQRTKKRFCYLTLSDSTGDFEAFIGEELLATRRDIMVPGAIVELTAKVDQRDGEIKIFTNTLDSLEMNAATQLKGLRIRLRSASPDTLDKVQTSLESIRSTPANAKGYVEIIAPLGEQREGHWRLSGQFSIDDKNQAAIRASHLIETIEEISA